MDYQINFGNRVFAVPAAAADHFLKLASELQLKVLLYLLRHADEPCTIADTAAFFRISEEQAEEAVDFWLQADILSDGQAPSRGVGFDFAPPAPKTPDSAPPAPEIPNAVVQRCSKDIKLDPSEIAHALEQSGELHDLFTCAEQIFGRFLNHMEQRSLLWMHSYLGMRSDVLLTLLGYCVSIEKVSMSYAESIAIRWMDAEILTLEQVEAEIRRLTEERSYTAQIQRMFEMKRRPTTQQKSYIDLWQKASYPMELIRCAYEITIESIDKLNFKYINSILENWASQGITTAEAARAARKSTAGSPPPQSADMDEYLSVVNRFRKE